MTERRRAATVDDVLAVAQSPVKPADPPVSRRCGDPAARHVALCALAYAASGALQPTLVDWLRYHGGTGVTMLPMLANTLAVACVAPLRELVLTSRSRSYADRAGFSWGAYLRSWRLDGPTRSRVGSVVALDFCANFLVMVGLLFVGSGVYAVLFSSGIAFAAVLSRLFGNKRYGLRQWAGVGLVTLGMGLNGAVAVAEAGSGEVGRLEVGGAAILLGTLLHSASLVAAEGAVAAPAPDAAAPDAAPEQTPVADDPPPRLTAFRLATYLGLVEASILVAHNLVLVAHHGVDKLYLKNVRRHHAEPRAVAATYGALWAADLAHALAHYALLESAGAVALTLSRGVQLLFVVGLTEVAFCGTDASQCLSPLKAVSIANVALGIALYASGAVRRARER